MKNERTLSNRTKALYESDSYLQSFQATVIDCIKRESFYAIELDQTAFFPEGGGQCSDTGLINQEKVLDVQKEEGRIYHITNTEFQPGEVVSCQLDFEKRYHNMQNHSGEHLVCGLIYKLYGYENVGFHLSNDIITVDIDGVLNAEDFDKIETLANEAIYENKAIYAVYPDENDTISYRSKLDLEEVRVIIIDDYDACACCAPHVKQTGEIGIIKILDYMNHRGGMRFTLKCGKHAYLELKNVFQQNKEIMGMLSSKREKCAEAVMKQCEQAKESRERETLLKKEIVQLYLKTLTDEHLFFSNTLDDIQVRAIINETVKTANGIVAGFMEQPDHSYRYIIGKSFECNTDLKLLAKKLNQEFQGRGGGSDMMIQGSLVASSDEIKSFFAN